MANISSQISLDAFVRRVLGKEGKDDDDYIRYMQIACDGLRFMHTHDFSIEATKVVAVDATTNTFSFPTDFVRHIWIATVIDGRWWVYTRDDTMAPLKDDDDVDIQTSLPNIALTDPIDSLGQAGGKNKYYFRPDRKNSRFQVGGYTPSIVVLKYISNGLDADGAILIQDYAALALEAFVRFSIADYDSIAESKIQRLQQQYKDRRREMRRVQRPTLHELRDVLYTTSGSLMR